MSIGKVTSKASAMGREDAHTSGLYMKRPAVIVRGEGAVLWDEDGRSYIDCVGGQGMASLGHGNLAVADAIAAQARTLASCTELFYNDRRAELYDLLAQILPIELDRYFLCNSGAEAVEGALKFARMSTKRPRIVATMRVWPARAHPAAPFVKAVIVDLVNGRVVDFCQHAGTFNRS